METDNRKKASEVLDEFETLAVFLGEVDRLSIKCNAAREELLGLSQQLRGLKVDMIAAVMEGSGITETAEKERAEALLGKTIDAVICGIESRADLYSKVLRGEVSTV